MRKEYTAGITEDNRKLLAEVHRQTTGPFTAGDAARIMRTDIGRARRLLPYWAARGWLARVRRGFYITVPLEARLPSERREDPWILANTFFAPGYIGGWSACEHWGLTEQIFNDIVFFTTKKPRNRHPVIKDTVFILKTISERKMFGLVNVWRRDIKVPISDPSRTVIDILAYPHLGGGIRHGAEIVSEYFLSEHRDDMKLIDYLGRLDNGAVAKRLGYLLESLAITAPELRDYCRANISAGYSKLDPDVKAKGRFTRRWNLAINVTVSGQSELE